MRLTFKELQMIAAALFYYRDNAPSESRPIILRAHKKILTALKFLKEAYEL
jgi:hypothetical protein